MRRRPIWRAALAGFAYFALVFAAGFALGVLRVLALVPRLGEIAAVLLELPVILIISWMACGWLIVRFGLPPKPDIRLIMGGVAFAMLMMAEFCISVLAFGRSPAEHMERYARFPDLLGLVGQLAFAVFPLMRHATLAAKGNQKC